MTKTHPVGWLSSQAATGLKDLPRNSVWLVSQMLRTPSAMIGDDGPDGVRAMPDGVRKVTAKVVDTLPGSHDSVEIRLKRAEAAVIRAKEAEQQALAVAEQAAERADTAKAIGDEGRDRIRDAARDGKVEVDRRTQEAQEHYGQLIDQEHEKASRAVAKRLEEITADVQARTDKARKEAEDAAAQAQALIDHAHHQMAVARELADEATAAAQEVAAQAHEQAQALAEAAEQRAGSADRIVRDARGAETRLARQTATAVRAEQKQASRSRTRRPALPERLTEHTKAELLELAQPLGVTGASHMTKAQLVRAIRSAARSR